MEEKKHSPNDLSDSARNDPDAVLQSYAGPSNYIKPQHRKPHDADVRFEEYFYYAQLTREDQKALEPPHTKWKSLLIGKKDHEKNEEGDVVPGVSPAVVSSGRLEISDKEWTDASRAFRTASWGACECFPFSFFLLLSLFLLGACISTLSSCGMAPGWKPAD